MYRLFSSFFTLTVPGSTLASIISARTIATACSLAWNAITSTAPSFVPVRTQVTKREPKTPVGEDLEGFGWAS
jgi:hypothetical protein